MIGDILGSLSSHLYKAVNGACSATYQLNSSIHWILSGTVNQADFTGAVYLLLIRQAFSTQHTAPHTELH